MNLKKPISAAMAAIMTLSVTATPVLAAESDPPNTVTQAENTDNSTTAADSSDDSAVPAVQSAGDAQSGSTTVTASVPGNYTIIVPESVAMTGEAGSGTKTATVSVRIKVIFPKIRQSM